VFSGVDAAGVRSAFTKWVPDHQRPLDAEVARHRVNDDGPGASPDERFRTMSKTTETPFEVPSSDRMAADVALVTCGMRTSRTPHVDALVDLIERVEGRP
jgi:hypothetical protein